MVTISSTVNKENEVVSVSSARCEKTLEGKAGFGASKKLPLKSVQKNV